jgi:hypothetical protein
VGSAKSNVEPQQETEHTHIKVIYAYTTQPERAEKKKEERKQRNSGGRVCSCVVHVDQTTSIRTPAHTYTYDPSLPGVREAVPSSLTEACSPTRVKRSSAEMKKTVCGCL